MIAARSRGTRAVGTLFLLASSLHLLASLHRRGCSDVFSTPRGLRGAYGASRAGVRRDTGSLIAEAPSAFAPRRAPSLVSRAAPTPDSFSAEEQTAAAAAYEFFSEQFPIASARKEFYGVPCGPSAVQSRFVFVAKNIGISAKEALDVFQTDLWVLTLTEEKFIERLAALRSVSDSEDQMLAFLRAAPRTLGTTTSEEIRVRGLDNMRARAALGAAYEGLISPLRWVAQSLAKANAANARAFVGDVEDASAEDLKKLAEDEGRSRTRAAQIFLGTSLSFLVYLSYMDVVYGGPIHGKGLCINSAFPTFNLPDAEGYSRLTCNCAPLYKWYIEPALSPEKRESMKGMAPKVESRNCGRVLGGKKRECDPTTPGGCVWTAEDLEKDPSTWDRKPK